MRASRDRRAIGWAVALTALAAVLPGRAASAPSAAEVLAAHCRARAALSTLRARFVQTRTFAAIGEEDRSAGTIQYRSPDALRWEFTEPDRSWTVLRAAGGWAVFPRLRQVQRFALDRGRADTLFSVVGLGPCGAGFADAFEVALAPPAGPGHVLSLVPRRPELAGAFARIELTLDPRDALPRKVVLHEPAGDSVSIALTGVERGVRLDRRLFELEVPEGYTVTP